MNASSNLPPGCTEASIPGCGAEDAHEEALLEHGLDYARGWEAGYALGWAEVDLGTGTARGVLGYIDGREISAQELELERLMEGAPA